MNFTVDKQTLADLGLPGKYQSGSIYNIFRRVKTEGGERLLDEMFQHPLSDAEQINSRVQLFRYFQSKHIFFPFNGIEVNQADEYLSMTSSGNLVSSLLFWGRQKIAASFLRDEQFNQLIQKLQATVKVLRQIRNFVSLFDEKETGPYDREFAKMRQIISEKKIALLFHDEMPPARSIDKLIKYDLLIRGSHRRDLIYLINRVYELDLFIAVGNIATEKKFSYAHALPSSRNIFNAQAIRHPSLDNGVPNTVKISGEQNVIFLTGANMAGKSTLMKSVGIAVYLAHIGFPVAAQNLEFSVMDGLYTSINVSDNLDMGYSHFYAEVKRVKHAAEEVAAGKKMVVIFDELFKGTNVKDAYDATLSVTHAFSKYRSCMFIVSTHIVEVGEALRTFDNMVFRYLPTIMDGEKPSYTYMLNDGISNDRHGMTIIRQEGILEKIAGRCLNNKIS